VPARPRTTAGLALGARVLVGEPQLSERQLALAEVRRREVPLEQSFHEVQVARFERGPCLFQSQPSIQHRRMLGENRECVSGTSGVAQGANGRTDSYRRSGRRTSIGRCSIQM
jgi:hypothetical protein